MLAELSTLLALSVPVWNEIIQINESRTYKKTLFTTVIDKDCLPDLMDFDKRVESAFRCMLVACPRIAHSSLNFCLYFFEQCPQVSFVEAVSNGH